MKISTLHYNELSKNDLYHLLALRIEVFVIEQNCPYQDLDGKDLDAFHVLIKADSGILIGTARILKAGVYYDEVAIGRVVSHVDFRHLKIGHELMKAAIGYIESELNTTAIRLSAQSHLLGFYQKHGFESTGKEYLEDGIPHTEMLRQ